MIYWSGTRFQFLPPGLLALLMVPVKPASNDLGVYVNKFGKTSVVWRYTLQSIGPSGIALNY